ncbi:MAG: tripartite tricarboxylate transporter TctB family protein [Firmicutes bacterium]|jgi:hypothetical protein|nr:tripartite tricarboxylate transporter TctB family protein [Bacillota bacterium]
MLIIELVVATVLAAANIYLGVVSVRMPLADRFWTGSGAFPLIVAVALTVCSLIWAAESALKLRRANIRDELDVFIRPFREGRVMCVRFLSIVVLSLIYILVLMPWLKFTLSTLLFLFATTSAYGRLKPLTALVLSVAVTAGVYSAFRYVLMLPLP